ncbi:uncharacterized protein C13orf42 homolog [Pelodytes ibericus]
MIRKIQSVFHPNSCSRDLVEGNSSYNGTISPVRLVRSTSMYVVGHGRQTFSESLKKYKSTNNIDTSSGGCQYKDDDKAWMFEKTQDFLQYLQDLLALRKKYLMSLHTLKSITTTSDYCSLSTTSSKEGKKPAPDQKKRDCKETKGDARNHSNSDIFDAISYFDSVIAELDSERRIREPRTIFSNEDVDFDVATSSREHSLHSNWILRVPRRNMDEVARITAVQSQTWKSSNGTSRFKRIERYPIYLPKAVEGAFNTLKFKPKPKIK